ncbi:COG4315 family predicted lipoprotein [Marmoricola sp. RAF53]|uniref:COG4315 family predicted lipoprotein n=1 Tax=Marmoricola sp. RAF53 TaxID=3233059 RepID=UPI003F9E5E35
MRRTAALLLALLAVLGALTAGCGDEVSPVSRPAAESSTSPTPPTPTAAAPSPTPPTPAAGTSVIAAGSKYGRMLYDAGGQPIYLFDAEEGRVPACYDDCARAWPPVLTDGTPQARAGVRPALLGTTPRTDGTTQVTYAGHPLYYYAHEGKYQVLCHDVVEYGGTWLVVRPDGTPAPG